MVALLTAILACVSLLSLSSAPAWAAADSITEFHVATASTAPWGITDGPDGNLWFTMSFGNIIGRITTQ
jgi:streptogramin lyase